MWEKIIVEEPPVALASATEIVAFEARHKLRLPADHREFLRTHGQGVLFNHFRIFGLKKIEEEIEETQDRWASYFVWDGEGSALTDEKLAKCFIIGDTFNADELVLSPGHPGKIFYLSADDNVCQDLGDSLEAALQTLVDRLQFEIANDYPEEERDQWDLRPVFNQQVF